MASELSIPSQRSLLSDGNAGGWRWIFRDRRAATALVLAVGVALAIRILAYLLADGFEHRGDVSSYQHLAEAIQSGQGLAHRRPGTDGLTPTAVFPPLPPLLLAGVGNIVPLSAATLSIFNSLVDCCSALLLARLGSQLGRRDIGVGAGLVYLVWPSIALMAPLAYKEGILIALLLATVVCLLEQAGKAGHRWAALSGLSAGMMALTQPALVPLIPMLFLVMRPAFGNWRRWLAVSLVAAFVAAMVMLPWWVRNAVAFGEFIPLTTSGGLALWVGAQVDGGGMVWQAPPSAWRNAPELAGRQLAQDGAWQLIAADPMGYVERCLAKLPRSFFTTNWAADQLIFARPDIDSSLAPFRWLRVFPTLFELVAAAMAIVGLARAPKSAAARLAYICLAQIMLFGIWFEFSERHRLFMTPFLLMLAVFGAVGGKVLRFPARPPQLA